MLAMEGLGHTGYSFSKVLETSEAVISNIRKGKNPPNVQLLERMLNKYEELDADWLLSGRGSMFKRPASSPATGGDEALQLLRAVTSRLERMEEMVQRSIRTQLERNVLTDEAVSDLQAQVEQLDKSVQKLTKAPRRTA